MIDFTIRECAAIIDGPIVMIRLGTCGAVSEDVKLGDIVVHDSSILIRRNPDAFRKGCENQDPYNISKPAEADKILKNLVNKFHDHFTHVLA
jgi:uridine phosphorylase